MLKKLQTKFILILMSFVSVILLSVFGIVCCSNYVHDKKDVERSLEMALRLKDKERELEMIKTTQNQKIFRFHLETVEILMGIPS